MQERPIGFKGYIFIIIGTAVITTIGPMRSKLKLMTAPKMSALDLTLSSANIDDQRRSLLSFMKTVCDTISTCNSIPNCRAAATRIDSLALPAQLPRTISENLNIYRQSLANSCRVQADEWDSQNPRKDGGSFWTYIFNWRIDHESPDSLPQKIFHLYGIDELAKAHTKISTIDCRALMYVKVHDLKSN